MRPEVDLRRARAGAQLLGDAAGGAVSGPVGIVRHLLAVQAQDLRAARLALRARSPGLRAADVDAALADGSLVVAWLMRGTLHLVAREDWAWLHQLTAPGREATSRRRLGRLGVPPEDAERAVAVIREALADGPRTRSELAERLAAEGIETEGQATPHLIGRASIDGVLVACGERVYTAAPPLEPIERATALAELGRRYLTAHAPATAEDLATWSGLPLRDTRTSTRTRYRAHARTFAGTGRLLPAFDEYLLGWRDRGFAVPSRLAKQVHPGGGVLRAVVVDDGEVVGTWSLRGGRVAIDGPAERFADEVADVERFASEAQETLRP